MNLQLPPEIEDSLRQHAAAMGMSAEQLAIVALQQGLSHQEKPPTDVMLPRQTWKAQFDALVAGFPERQADARVDCSRDSIYGDRGQ